MPTLDTAEVTGLLLPAMTCSVFGLPVDVTAPPAENRHRGPSRLPAPLDTIAAAAAIVIGWPVRGSRAR